ncbi:MAG: hydroxymethylpyrimidine/phosphomethylpyrimidine kinase [bacterium]
MNVSLNRTTVPLVLSIAGLDPSGGAGVYADIKTFSSLNVWGMGVVTTLTNQDSKNFRKLLPVDKDYFNDTIQDLFENHNFAAIKIGLITQEYQIDKISECIKKYKHGIVVMDPVMGASTGFNFWDEKVSASIVEKLIPYVDAISPNYVEAMAILKILDVSNLAEINRKEIVRLLHKQFRCKVALTGGDAAFLSSDEHEGKVEDIFYDGLELKHRIGTFIDIPSHFKHGTGCTFSSALASYLAMGEDFVSSCFKSAFFVENALNNIMSFGKNNGGLDQNSFFRGVNR